jgi:hypothetical protein
MQLDFQKNASAPHPSGQWSHPKFWFANMCKVVGFEQWDFKDTTLERRYEQPFWAN